MKTPPWLTAAALVLAACGGSSTASDAAGMNDAGSATGACNFPSCLQNAGAACVPDGACTSQIGTGTMTVCYANGLRYATTTSATAASLSVSNGGKTCFTGTAPEPSAASITFTLKSSAGATIATMTEDLHTAAVTVTCTGEQPVELNAACAGGSDCVLGTCP